MIQEMCHRVANQKLKTGVQDEKDNNDINTSKYNDDGS